MNAIAVRGSPGLEQRLTALAERDGGVTTRPITVWYPLGEGVDLGDLVFVKFTPRRSPPGPYIFHKVYTFSGPEPEEEVDGDGSAYKRFHEAVPQLLKNYGVEGTVLDHVNFSTVERMLNGCESVRGVKNGQVDVSLTVYPDRVAVGICHNGEGFDVVKALNPLAQGELRKRGHGLNICYGLADEFAVTNYGRNIEMVFYRPKLLPL